MPDFCFFLPAHISVRLDCCGGADLADGGISKNLAEEFIKVTYS
jgi:hypothetical protein